MRENSIRKALREGQVVIGGSVSQLKGVVIPQIYAAAGFQFIYIDMQHSAYTVQDIFDLVIGARDCENRQHCSGSFVRRPFNCPSFGLWGPRSDDP